MVKPGYKQTEIGEIPEDWEVKELADICAVNPSSPEPLPNEFIYIDLESVVQGRLVEKKLIEKKEAPSRAQRHFTDGDILYQTVRPYQKNNLFVDFDSDKYIASTGYAVVRAKQDECVSKLLYFYLHSDKFVSNVLDNCTGTSYPAINPNVLAKLKIGVPVNFIEQQRIAEALSDVDALIASLEKLIAKKKAIKQGAMQRLLTGKTRLPGFEGEWKRDSLANAITLYNGYAFKSSEYTQSGKYPVITIANVHRGKMVMDSYNTIDSFPSDLQSYQKLVNGDCLISMTGNVGRVCLVNQANCLLNQRVGKIVPNGLYDSDFIYWILNTDDFLETMVELAKGGAQPNVGKNDILGYEFFIPIDRREQKCIAKIIGDINDEIEVLTQKLSKTRQLKQGMMQQLLTGKIRLV